MGNPFISCFVYALETLIYDTFFSRISDRRYSYKMSLCIALLLFEMVSIVNLVLNNNIWINTVAMVIAFQIVNTDSVLVRREELSGQKQAAQAASVPDQILCLGRRASMCPVLRSGSSGLRDGIVLILHVLPPFPPVPFFRHGILTLKTKKAALLVKGERHRIGC